jgi:Putative quorum-sensing-regulated virulence factor
MRMPFGKYRGERLEDIPLGYLEWLLTIELSSRLQQAVEYEIEERNSATPPPPPPRSIPQKEIHASAEEIVKAGYRELSHKYHPDKAGGDLEKMKTLNLANEWLRGQLKVIKPVSKWQTVK